MKILFIGQYNQGSTTRMRGEYLKEILSPSQFIVANIDIPIAQTSKLFRSAGWRYFKGPLIKNINRYISDVIKNKGDFDLVWVDKGVFITPGIISSLKKQNNTVVHYTPDTAFTYNRSSLFYKALPFYDYCITTKSFEIDDYNAAGSVNTLYCTQGYDERLHQPYHSFEEKDGVCFIGLNEPEREAIILSLINRNITVKLGGAKWNRFVREHRDNSNLLWLGEGLFGTEYAKAISGSLLGLGLLSRKFPELHTTRTFEIPACGTVLVTENNIETNKFFKEEEVLFFDNINELSDKVDSILNDKERLRTMSYMAHKTVIYNGYDYRSIVSRLLMQMKLIA
jgi:spore maturation protein CgeB